MTVEALDSIAPKPMYRAVKTSRLYEQIVQQGEDSILKGQLKPGDQLPAERDLAQRFGVSRTAVREAVKTLREKGLVEAYSGRGTFVTNGTSHAIRQSLDLMIRINQQEGSANLAELRLVLEEGSSITSGYGGRGRGAIRRRREKRCALLSSRSSSIRFLRQKAVRTSTRTK